MQAVIQGEGQKDLEPVEFASDLGFKAGRHRSAIAGRQFLQPGPAVPAQGIVVEDSLGAEQALDPIGVLDPLDHQRLALAAETAAVFFFWRRRPHH